TLSLSDVIVTGLIPVLVTTTLKVKSPPGSGRLSGLAVVCAVITGGTLVRVTVALSLAWTVSPLWSTAVAVTVSVCVAPGGPVNGAVNVQVYDAPGWRTVPTAVVQVPRLARLPYTLSVRDVIVTGSVLLLVTTTVKVKSPPGSGR